MSVSRIMLERIKERLRRKGVTYKKLAKEMKVAESTVKRWFSARSLSLGQLDQLCERLEIDLSDFSNSKDASKIRESFTPDQETFLVANEKALVLFYLLASNVEVKEVEALLGFRAQETERLLLALDKHKLIELKANTKIRLLAKAGSWWDPRGPLSKKYYDLIKSDFIMSDFSKAREEQWFFSGPLTETSQAVISKKMNELALEFKELYWIDRNEKKAKNVLLFCGIRPWVFPLLKNYLKVKNGNFKRF